jgi:hypothetical protein
MQPLFQNGEGMGSTTTLVDVIATNGPEDAVSRLGDILHPAAHADPTWDDEVVEVVAVELRDGEWYAYVSPLHRDGDFWTEARRVFPFRRDGDPGYDPDA